MTGTKHDPVRLVDAAHYIQGIVLSRSFEISNVIRWSLATSINGTIRDTLARYGSMPGEVELLVGMHLRATKLLNNGFRAILKGSGVDVSVSGVFCHQSPKVELVDGPFSGKRCELGDLLIVVQYCTPWGQINNAMLLQAKLVENLENAAVVQGVQFELYKNWPRFHYFPVNNGAPEHRGVTPPVVHQGAQFAYLVPSPGYWNSPQWRHFPTGGNSQNAPYDFLAGMAVDRPCLRPLTDELFEALILSSGRPFDDKVSSLGSTDWSRVIWDLLVVTANRLFNRKSVGVSGASRGQLHLVASGVSVPPTLILEASGLSKENLAATWNSDSMDNWRDLRGDAVDDGSNCSVVVIEMRVKK